MRKLIGGYDVALERGPDWLFIRLSPSRAGCPRRGAELARALWELARDHGTRRLLLELDEVDRVDDTLLDGLSTLGRLVGDDEGMVRVCGLTGENLDRYASCPSLGHLPHFPCRGDAVTAGAWESARPTRPR